MIVDGAHYGDDLLAGEGWGKGRGPDETVGNPANTDKGASHCIPNVVVRPGDEDCPGYVLCLDEMVIDRRTDVFYNVWLECQGGRVEGKT